MSKITLEDVEEWIKDQIPLSEAEADRKYHKDYDDGSAQRELRRLRVIKELLCAGANIINYGNGYVDIEGDNSIFRFYLLKQRWSSAKSIRSSWRYKKRYRCKSPTDFVNRYVKDGNEDASI